MILYSYLANLASDVLEETCEYPGFRLLFAPNEEIDYKDRKSLKRNTLLVTIDDIEAFNSFGNIENYIDGGNEIRVPIGKFSENCTTIDTKKLMEGTIYHSGKMLKTGEIAGIDPELFCGMLQLANYYKLTGKSLNLFVTNLLTHLLDYNQNSKDIIEFCAKESILDKPTRPAKLMMCDFLFLKEVWFKIDKNVLYVGPYSKMTGDVATTCNDEWVDAVPVKKHFYSEEYVESMDFDTVVIRPYIIDGGKSWEYAERRVFVSLLEMIPMLKCTVPADFINFLGTEDTSIMLNFMRSRNVYGISNFGLYDYDSAFINDIAVQNKIKYLEITVPELAKKVEDIEADIDHVNRANRSLISIPCGFSKINELNDILMTLAPLEKIRIKIQPNVDVLALDLVLENIGCAKIEACYLVCHRTRRTIEMLKLLKEKGVESLKLVFTEENSFNTEIKNLILSMTTVKDFSLEFKSTDDNSREIAEMIQQMGIDIIAVNFATNVTVRSHQNTILDSILKNEGISRLIIDHEHSDGTLNLLIDKVYTAMQKISRQNKIAVGYSWPANRKFFVEVYFE